MREQILKLLSYILGDGYNTTDDNYSYYCPKCNHRKRKLEIDVLKGLWHCWVCNRGGKSLFTLFKWLGRPAGDFNQLKEIDSISPLVPTDSKNKSDKISINLPSEFISLAYSSTSFYYRAAINYLNGRGISYGDILKYNIGYCEDGQYNGMIIIPSYSRTGQLNYFVTRAYMPDPSIEFKNPKISRDIIGFELTINWNQPIILVESAFDAIAIKRNAIPLFGKSILPELRKKLLAMNSGEVVICLDGDAKADALNQVDFFLGNGIRVKIVELNDADDPSSIGYFGIWNIINSTDYTDEHGLLRKRIKDHLYGKGKTRLPRIRHSLPTLSAAQRISGSF